jgi:hypothetical protein
MREVTTMGKATENGGKRSAGVSERGGYPAGPKTADQLAPPPKGPAPGAKPSGNGSSSAK